MSVYDLKPVTGSTQDNSSITKPPVRLLAHPLNPSNQVTSTSFPSVEDSELALKQSLNSCLSRMPSSAALPSLTTSFSHTQVQMPTFAPFSARLQPQFSWLPNDTSALLSSAPKSTEAPTNYFPWGISNSQLFGDAHSCRCGNVNCVCGMRPTMSYHAPQLPMSYPMDMWSMPQQQLTLQNLQNIQNPAFSGARYLQQTPLMPSSYPGFFYSQPTASASFIQQPQMPASQLPLQHPQSQPAMDNTSSQATQRFFETSPELSASAADKSQNLLNGQASMTTLPSSMHTDQKSATPGIVVQASLPPSYWPNFPLNNTMPASVGQSSMVVPGAPPRAPARPVSVPSSAANSAASDAASSLAKFKTKTRVLTCVTCKKNFANRSSLIRHGRTHSGSKPYLCRMANCGKRFSDVSNAKRHEITHLKLKPFVCPVDDCQYRFSRKNSLMFHLSSTHDMASSDLARLCKPVAPAQTEAQLEAELAAAGLDFSLPLRREGDYGDEQDGEDQEDQEDDEEDKDLEKVKEEDEKDSEIESEEDHVISSPATGAGASSGAKNVTSPVK